MEKFVSYYICKNKSFVEISKLDAISKIKSQCDKSHDFAGSIAGGIAGVINNDLPGAIIGAIFGHYIIGSYQSYKHYAINRISCAYDKDDIFKVSANLISDTLIGSAVVALNWSNKKINLPFLAMCGGISIAALAYADLEHLSAEKFMANDDFMSCSEWLQD